MDPPWGIFRRSAFRLRYLVGAMGEPRGVVQLGFPMITETPPTPIGMPGPIVTPSLAFNPFCCSVRSWSVPISVIIGRSYCVCSANFFTSSVYV